MLYSLMMLITINGHADAYVLDHGLTRSDCTKAVARSVELYRRPGARVQASFVCKAQG